MLEETPFQRLQAIEADCLAHAAGLPRMEEPGEDWLALAVNIGEHSVLVPLEEVGEIASVPSLTRVPRAPAWVKGIANVRGDVVPLFDLSRFLGGPATQWRSEARVLITTVDRSRIGFVIGRSLGLRRFDVNDIRPPGSHPGELGAFLEGEVADTRRSWPVFSLHRVVGQADFADLAGRAV